MGKRSKARQTTKDQVEVSIYLLWHKQWVGSAPGQNRLERTERKENDENATDQEPSGKYEAEGNSGSCNSVSKTVVDSYVK